MTKEEFEECKALLEAWFTYQTEQGAFNRARWAIRKLAKELGLDTVNEKDFHENDP